MVDAGHQTLTGWTAGGAGVDIVDAALWNADEGSRSIDLNAFNPGSISQTIETVPGQTYNVTFAMSGNPDANVVRGAEDDERHRCRHDSPIHLRHGGCSRTRPRT